MVLCPRLFWFFFFFEVFVNQITLVGREGAFPWSGRQIIFMVSKILKALLTQKLSKFVNSSYKEGVSSAQNQHGLSLPLETASQH